MNGLHSALICADLLREGPILPTWLSQMTYCITEASAKHPADRIRNGAGETTGTSGQGDVDDHKEADRITSEEARSEAVAYWKDRFGGGTAHAAIMRTIQSAPRSLISAKGRSFGLSYAGMGDALDLEQDWADHRLMPRSSVKPRRIGDCTMNESWFDDPAVITGHVTFAWTRRKHMSRLRTAICCEKIGFQLACLTLELGDWPDCASNASIYQQIRHSGRSAASAGVWRAEISCAGPHICFSG
jgi:hypothetical protein